ncbi:GlsB/YeaQ/YmgE family stress response membrane protein [Croceicoccus sp. F390]|uniref:GlsB/YeaQ/YmgE family stress response membrane protein n=1 Tax=Croceicoccus esteveae TaxID=3075597 RepID=A0ABU2ZHH1_9SPHN|nr:GlsB/YeaQ/YmgE family stress response membrane protein [Croceicoccus sp. F390]MDT0574862.1 GlsB/YeaQ/YmgE family stress response membrane protein [Croceicoccus sp. F390]
MSWIIAIIVGGIIGWLASIVMRRDASMGIFWNIVVGIVGSFLGRIIGGLVGAGSTLTSLDPVGLLMSFIGAVVLLAIVNLIQRGRAR